MLLPTAKRQIRAQEGPQRQFSSSHAETVVYGGSAFGGKTWILVYDPLKWIHDPKFRAVIFRRTFPQITAPGGLWDEASEWYPLRGGKPLKAEMAWRFPSGAVISFRHLEHEADMYDWQGSQVPYFGFDELSHFSERVFTYIAYSRGRTTSTVQPHVRATCNPDPGWIKKFLEPWVDKTFDGVKAESGEIRWFIQDGSKRVWVPEGTPDAKSLSFIRARITDNKIGLAKNPRYLPNLKALPPIERARLLEGDWDVRHEGLVYYQPEHGIDFQACIVDELSENLEGQHIGGVDFGFKNAFCALAGFLDHDDVFWVTWCRYKSQTTLPVHSEALPKGVRWWCDPAQPESIVLLRQAGHDCLACRHKPMRGASGETRSPKLAGIDLVAERIRNGSLKILRSTCQPLIREFGMYHYDPDKLTEEPVDEDNHSMDALRYMLVGTYRGHAMPSVVSEDEIRDQQKVRESVIEAQLKQRQQDVQAARHEDIDDPMWWDGDTTSDTLELIVEAGDPALLDRTVQGLGAAVVGQDDDGRYVPVDGGWSVRCYKGCGGYVAYAINKQGYGKVLRRRRV